MSDSGPIAKAEVAVDPQHGPVIRVKVCGVSVAVYLFDRTGVATDPFGGQAGIEVTGPWHEFYEAVAKVGGK